MVPTSKNYIEYHILVYKPITYKCIDTNDIKRLHILQILYLLNILNNYSQVYCLVENSFRMNLKILQYPKMIHKHLNMEQVSKLEI